MIAPVIDLTGLPLGIFILDRLSGKPAPLVPGLFERALAAAIQPPAPAANG